MDSSPRTAEIANLRADLLTATKECHKKYGSRRIQLATELDAIVERLCARFEAIFEHGLKTTNQSTLKQAAQKLRGSCGSRRFRFWECVHHVLSYHERNRFHTLRNVRTAYGRGRAWLRCALNERSLERYLYLIVGNEPLLVEYYEPWAFLRDQENSNLLLTVAAGLAPIVFAMSIDRENLNHEPENSTIGNLNSEQIILTTSIDILKVNDIGKKMHRNVLNFEEMSVTEEPIGNYDEINTHSNDFDVSTVAIEIAEDVSTSMALSEQSETTMDEENEVDISVGLRPVGDQVVGELIPVNSSDDVVATLLDGSSEDGVSIASSDESNVQKLYEQGKEQLKEQLTMNGKLEARIEELNRENEVLKHQLRKYVSAVQMLKQEDADHTFEAQIYENKLVQVAEMHGELMELNNRLQIMLVAKDEQIRNLREQLVVLRGPLPLDDFALHALVSLWVPSAFLAGSRPDPHHVYQVHLRINSEEWNIYRRYAQFYKFHQNLKKEYSAVSNFQFPPKKTIGNKDAQFVEERRKKLQLYLRQLINFLTTQDSQLAVNPSKSLFISRIQFFSEQYKQGNSSQSRSHSIFSNCLSQSPSKSDDSSIEQYTGL